MNLTATHTKNDFAPVYYSLRKTEGRIYTDDEVALLPTIGNRHMHHKEWLARKASCDRLVKYLSDRKKGLRILEVGCGNGWLAAKLAVIPGSVVTGIDVNAEELEQAKRVFNKIGNLEFFNCSLDDLPAKDLRFDVIVFAASIQYFPSLKKLLDNAITRLKPGGEIHVMDSNFYQQKDLAAAQQRTSEYYQSVGFPEMIGQYFHHTKEELTQFDHEILYDPHTLINLLRTNKNPFYWIRINA